MRSIRNNNKINIRHVHRLKKPLIGGTSRYTYILPSTYQYNIIITYSYKEHNLRQLYFLAIYTV